MAGVLRPISVSYGPMRRAIGRAGRRVAAAKPRRRLKHSAERVFALPFAQRKQRNAGRRLHKMLYFRMRSFSIGHRFCPAFVRWHNTLIRPKRKKARRYIRARAVPSARSAAPARRRVAKLARAKGGGMGRRSLQTSSALMATHKG